MDIFKFQTEYLNSLERSRLCEEEVNSDYYQDILLNNINDIFIELSLNLNNPKYKTFTSILFNDFNDIYSNKICSMFLPYYVTFTQTVIDGFNGSLEDYNRIYFELHNKIAKSNKFYNWTPDLNNEIITLKNTMFFNNKKITTHIDICFSNKHYKPIYELLIKMTGNLSNYLYKYISDLLYNKLNSSTNIVEIIKEFQNHDLFNENNKKEILTKYTKNNLKEIFKQIVVNKNKDYIYFLNYIQDSCLFIDNYKKYLAFKAINTRNNIDIDYHNRIIAKCNKLNFLDSNHCKKILDESNKIVGFYNTQIEFILGTYGLWPSKTSNNYYCDTFEPTRKMFEGIYEKEHKKIHWVYDDITAEIEFNNYLLIVPINMVDYLMKFNNDDLITSTNSNIEKFLLKMKIIKKKKNMLQINEGFVYKTKTIDLKTKKTKKPIELSTKNIVDLEYYIDSKIVKHMKRIKKINKNTLLNQSDFKNIDEILLEKRLNSLQSRDFIQINKEDIIYVP